MTEGAKHPVQTTEKSLELIDKLKNMGPTGVTNLSEELSMGPSAVHSHLNTLRDYGYVRKEDGKYRLALKFLEYGGYVRGRMTLYREGEEEINRLAEETGELVNLMTLENGQGVYLYRAKGPEALDFDTYAGIRNHLNTTAMGKAILAHLPDSEVMDIIERHGLPKHTDQTITDIESLTNELDQVRERGYAIDDEERARGVRCLGAPILGENDEVFGALSITAPTSRLKGETLNKVYPEKILSAANVIELNIKYNQ